MTRIILAAASLLLLGACATQLPQTPPAGMSAEISAPQLRPGSVWRYAVSDGFTKLSRGTIEYRVSSVGANDVTMEVSSDGQQRTEMYTRDGNWLMRPATNMQVFSYNPAYRAFDFPLVAGKRWKSRSTATDPADGRSFPVRIEGEVLGWERIKVPAGEFDTLKIQRLVFLDYWLQGERGESVIRETDWYAPSLNQVARRETTSQYLRLADHRQPFRFVRARGGGGSDERDGDALPRFEQDDWLVYELVSYSNR
jgi:hypothetical protein